MNQSSFVCTQLSGFKYCYLTLIILRHDDDDDFYEASPDTSAVFDEAYVWTNSKPIIFSSPRTARLFLDPITEKKILKTKILGRIEH